MSRTKKNFTKPLLPLAAGEGWDDDTASFKDVPSPYALSHVNVREGIRGIVLFLFCSLLCLNAHAAIVVCGASATGNGSGADWNNQCAFSSVSLGRGNTYYLASGSYGSRSFSTSASGTTLITIKKAVAADHGTDTGWSSTYGTGQAKFPSWNISTPYWVFDGQTGGGPGSWETGHGIFVGSLTETYMIIATAGNLTFRHIEATGMTTVNAERTLFYFVPTGPNITMQYMWAHDTPCDFFQIRGDMDKFTMEYSKFSRNSSDAAGCHGDVFEFDSGVASNWTHRYNWFADSVGTYLWGSHESGTFSNAQIYGNIISGGLYSNGMIAGLSGGGIITGLQFYNNTIANVGENSGFGYLDRGTNNRIDNNIWYNTSPNMMGTDDYNAFFSAGTDAEAHVQTGSGDPFVNSTGNDYRLKAATNAGLMLTGLNSTDLLGNVRGADGVWDRGAYEFVSGAPPPPPPPSGSVCDVNKDNTTNIVDVQQCVNQSLGVATCTADINKDGICNVVDVQRVVNAALGGPCVSP